MKYTCWLYDCLEWNEVKQQQEPHHACQTSSVGIEARHWVRPSSQVKPCENYTLGHTRISFKNTANIREASQCHTSTHKSTYY